MREIQKYLDAISRLEDKYVDELMDNVSLAGIQLMLCSDGSGHIQYEWNDATVQYPVETQEDLIKTIKGAGKTEVVFHSISELESLLRQYGVLDE